MGHKTAPKVNYKDEKNLANKDYTISLATDSRKLIVIKLLMLFHTYN